MWKLLMRFGLIGTKYTHWCPALRHVFVIIGRTGLWRMSHPGEKTQWARIFNPNK